MVKIEIPGQLWKLINTNYTVEVEGKTIIEAIKNLENKYPELKDRICDEKGKIRRFLNVYLNDTDIRFLKGDQTPVSDGDKISIIPALAGG